MGKVWKAVQNTTYALSGIAMFAVILLIFINVLCRYIFKYSIPWCEELTRYMFIAVIFLTLNVMVSQGASLRVDVLDNFMGPKGKFVMELICSIFSAIALGVFAVSGMQLVEAGKLSVSPSLHIPMNLIYAMLPVGYALALIETVRKEILAIRAYRKKKEEAA